MISPKTLRLSLLLACTAPAAATAQTAYLQYSGIEGQGTLLTISRLPTADSKGNITYYDGSFNITVSGSGVPTLDSAPFTPSPSLQTNGFIAGRYYVKVGSCAAQFGDVTSGVGNGGATVWTLIMEETPDCDGAYPDEATWQTGAPAPDVAARLAKANVPNNPNYSYGLTDVGGGCCGPFASSNGLLAAEQVSQDLTLISYTSGYGDQSGQVGSVIYTLCANKKCTNAPK